MSGGGFFGGSNTGSGSNATGPGGSFFQDNLSRPTDALEEDARAAATRAETAETAAKAAQTAAETALASAQAVASVTNDFDNLGLTGYAFSLSGVSTGDLIHWDGTNLSPLGQANVTDGGNF